MPLYFHHPSAFLGLHNNFWKKEVASYEVPAATSVDLFLNQINVTHGNDEENYKPENEEEFYDCLKEKVGEKLNDPNVTATLCDAPLLGALKGVYGSKLDGLRVCQDAGEYKWSKAVVFVSLIMASNCPRPVREVK